MKKSLFISEWKQIFSNKKVWVPIVGVIFVPILYAGMFLWSFWDPYSQLDKLPVAVVNEDAGATLEGERLVLGNELVDKLKDNNEFQFHFRTREKGYKGLEKQEYYMLVEIPADFSQNATTLMDEAPKQLELKYVPNESYNFLSAQIGETAVKEIKTAIANEISATYAETMFDRVHEMSDGLTKASDGSGSLNEGAETLQNGTQSLKENLAHFAAKAIEFQQGTNKAMKGANLLATGMTDFSTAIEQFTEANEKLLNASTELQVGTGTLTNGITDIQAGASQMEEKIPSLVDATKQIEEGLRAFQNKLPKEMANAIGEKSDASAGAMSQGLDQLQSRLGEGLSREIAAQLSQQQEAQMTQLFQALKQSNVDPQVIQALQEQVANNTPSQKQLEAQLKQEIDKGLQAGFVPFKEEVNNQFAATANNMEMQIQQAVDPTFNELLQGLEQVNDGQSTLLDGITKLAGGSNELAAGADKLNNGQQQFVDSMQQFQNKLVQANGAVKQLEKGATDLDDGMHDISNGAQKMNDGSQKLAEGSVALDHGATDLQKGTNELHQKLDDAADEASSVKADDDTYEMFSNPVALDKNEINHVPNYGTGFAPYFVSLGLFVGALLITIVYQIKEPAIQAQSGITWFIGKFGVLSIVGILQALLVDAVLLLGLDIEVKSVPLFIVTTIITSLVFIVLIQFLVTTLGDPGRFIAIVLLILQLTTSAGTFPLELIPNMLQPINALLPMTYSVQAFKAVISSGDFSFMWHNIGILACYLFTFAMLTIVYFTYKTKKNPNGNEALQ
ncbi:MULTISPECIES: YhgE/Pip domain-containing protein [unclassified Virgibacillus]|uniref:YhgE/Pip family protein n=1 Tax=unclassified Virgibacillus TaxID=2620237 RepID=UPI0024DEA5F1|nr:YhgE/Pip domain-containing protein [Virgibacillus sp. LDC-1]